MKEPLWPKVLNDLVQNPKERYTFNQLAKKHGTYPSAVVSAIRAIAKRGHGEFRDRLVSERQIDADGG